MLLVFGTHGSPGASTLSILTATSWTLGGREVALIDGDPTGGTLASHLGLFQDPGVASLILSRTIEVDTVLTCSQRVLVENLRVLPLPTSVAGSAASVERLSERGEELSQVATKLPLIIDAGRAYYGTPMAALVPHAKAVIFVVQSAHIPSLASLTNYRQMLGIDVESLGEDSKTLAGSDRLEALLADSLGIVTIGPSYFAEDEFKEQTGLSVVASMPYDPDLAYDFADTLLMPNRRSKNFMADATSVANILWNMAHPQMAQKLTTEDMFVEDPFAVAFEGVDSVEASRRAEIAREISQAEASTEETTEASIEVSASTGASAGESMGVSTKESSESPRQFGVRP